MTELVAQSIAVLRAYVQHFRPQIPEQARSQIEHRPTDRPSGRVQTNGAQTNGNGMNGGSGNGGLHMSTQEAFDVLGLEPTPSPREIKAAHRRLAHCSIRNRAVRTTSARRSMRPGTFSWVNRWRTTGTTGC